MAEAQRCICGCKPTLARMGSRSYLVRYTCRGCGFKGVNATTADRATDNWNAEVNATRQKREGIKADD